MIEEVLQTADAMEAGQACSGLEKLADMDVYNMNDFVFELSPSSARDGGSQDSMFGAITLEKFWEYVGRSQRALDENTASFIKNQVTKKVCSCDLECQLVCCTATGGIYAVEEKCFSSTEKSPASAILDEIL